MSIERKVCGNSAYESASLVWFRVWSGNCRRRHLVGKDDRVVKVSKAFDLRSRFFYEASRFYYNGN